MRFLLDAEQAEFGRTLGRLLAAADVPAAVRAWGTGDSAPGHAVWRRLAGTGVFGLAVPEKHGGAGFLPVELTLSFVELGRYAVPGPAVETAAAAVLLERLGDADGGLAGTWLPAIAAGDAMVSYADLAHGPYALDAATADVTFLVDGDTLRACDGCGPVQPSVDPARRLTRCAGGAVLASGPAVWAAAAQAADTARLLTAAQALGVGRRLLDDTVAYVKQRTQFGVAVGSFQAVKHRLADVLLALEFAEPLVYGAAVEWAGALQADTANHGYGATGAGIGVAMAKVAAGEAAYTAARAALQLHGALGYTDELGLSLWIRRARALRGAWGTPAECRARVLAGPAPAGPQIFHE
ncbi:acyl-CoA dehydrogenase [Streptomyces albofaciens JCM 4342]|uniref:acyl-CoA dehydrogenase n=1 Tax=Streptomyces albofaciens TaxID=66866 RepID=UPI00123983E0|nr:acyl-CoA dehydrogenase [Streptomyces albofaciens]KAA6212899.1 acyl-CoA dehydrogenase [Streptomyces albofaciens JCM 4342]